MRFGSYEVGCEVGRGAQGAVYRGIDARSGRVVAVKAFYPHRGTGTRGDDVARRASELQRLRHPGICPVLDAGQDGERSFVVMEYLRGRPLERHLRDSRGDADGDAGTPAHDAAQLVEDLARAAHAAHESGVVHRDIKPSNVMLTEDGRSVLLDFGLSSSEGRAPEIAGTPGYMAPEQVRSETIVDRRADVHALGALLFELLTLERPFAGATRNAVLRELLQRQVRVPDSVPPSLAAILETALAKRPAHRYPSSLALAEDLARFRRGERVLARRPGPLRRLAVWADLHRPSAVLVALLIALTLLVAIAAELEGIAARRLRRQLVRYADLERTAALVESEAGGAWVVGPSGVSGLEDWVAEAEGILARQGGAGTPSADLADLPGALARMGARAGGARTLVARSIDRYASRWRATRAELADPMRRAPYAELALPPQAGLVPLGRDPRSDFLEFAHVQSGSVPERDSRTDELVVGPETAIVLVLVPGGTFVMGGAAPWAQPAELPVHTVTLDPFFVSKFEVTIAQWIRLAGTDPTNGARSDPTCPVYQVSWRMATDLLPRWGLALPTEAQWEYAARAGTRTAWSCGDVPSSLDGHANVWDRASTRESSGAKVRLGSLDPRLRAAPGIDDGFSHVAPVGRFLPNAFGLFDVHGNALELVRDAYGPYSLPWKQGDGERLGGKETLRIARGGAFSHSASTARLAARFDVPRTFRSYQGCRPARAIAGAD